MTGAILPHGTDTVIRHEDLDIRDGIATVTTEDIRQWQNAHLKGTDRHGGDVIVPSGVRIGAAELGIAATVGKAQLLVHTLPRVALIATGDELVPVDAQPLPHQIRMSNIYALQGLLHSWHVPTELMHIRDDRDSVAQQLGAALKQYDVLIMSGGVSAGKFDHMPSVLEELGIPKIFDKVQQRPGKPFWFGAANGKTVFALPGNPVPAFMCATRYIQPWLRACFDMPLSPTKYAVLEEDVSFKSNLTLFLQVKLSISPDGRWIARPEAGKGSGDLANLVRADGFLELPIGQQHFRKGESYPLWLYRSLLDN
jgi:molybdopterin molybdotransferase